MSTILNLIYLKSSTSLKARVLLPFHKFNGFNLDKLSYIPLDKYGNQGGQYFLQRRDAWAISRVRGVDCRRRKKYTSHTIYEARRDQVGAVARPAGKRLGQDAVIDPRAPEKNSSRGRQDVFVLGDESQ